MNYLYGYALIERHCSILIQNECMIRVMDLEPNLFEMR